MSELSDDQASIYQALIARGTGTLAASASVTVFTWVATKNVVAAIRITNAVTVPIENCNVVANAALVWRIERAGANTILKLINNSGVSVDYSFTLLGYT